MADQKPVSVQWLGSIREPALGESSGLAFSRRQLDLLWTHNDSGNSHDLHALSLDGTHLGTARIGGLGIGDWEDMAAFELDGTPYLMVGDVGDNFRWRRVLHLHVVQEPPLKDGRLPDGTRLQIAWSIDYTYPDDARRDCEAIGVDVGAGQVLLVSKRVVPAEVFVVPLRPEGKQPVVARRIALLDKIPQPTRHDEIIDPDYWQWRAQPTALALSERRAAVVTYKDAFLFERGQGEDWAAAFSRLPLRLRLPAVHGREAAAFSPDGKQLYFSDERTDGLEASIFRVTLEAPAEPPAAAPPDAGTDAGGGS